MTDDETRTEEQAEQDQQDDAEAKGDGSAEQDQQGDGSAGGDDEVAKARKASEEEEEAKEKVKQLEEDPPEKLEDWPDDKAKYETFGGAEGNESYEESVTSKLGPSSLRHREDGGVEIEGEEVDDPEKYKGDPIPGGPTDPKLGESRAYGEPDLTDETSVDVEGSDDSGDSEGSEDSDDVGDSGGNEKSPGEDEGNGT